MESRQLSLLPTEEEEDRRIDAEHAAPPSPPREAGSETEALSGRSLVALWAVALVPRFYYLFALSNPENAGDGWYGDTYHHWQIAYLTKEVGFSAPGGPRLWDLKGLEYFWGVLHPLLLVGLFYFTGSIDIIVARLVSLFFGALVVVLIFLLCRRYWGSWVAAAAAGFAALAPTSIFNDGSGMLEPLGVAFCLLGIWLWPKRGVWTGVAWALASMARAEAWIFSLGLVVATFLRREEVRQRLPMLLAWAAGMLLYMKVMLDATGNPIYPVWWNFLANAYGWWEFRPQLTPEQVAVRPVLGVLLALAAAGLAWTLWKRPRGYLLLTFGFGYWVFATGMLGFTAYLKSWESWFWMIRFWAFPYEFLAVIAAVALFSRLARPLALGVVAAALIAVQVEWVPILAQYHTTDQTWSQSVESGRYLGELYNRAEYRGGALNLPPDKPALTYTLARYGRVEGKHLVGQLYDPFYYLPAGYAYADHPQAAGTLLECWLDKTGTRLWAVDRQSTNYIQFVGDHPEWFQKVGEIEIYDWTIYGVSVPRPAQADCQAAARAAGR